MSLVNRMLASVGVGSSKVDTQLFTSKVEAGNALNGKIVVYGGKVKQSIDSIYLFLMTQFVKEVNDRKVLENFELAHYQIAEQLVINPGDNTEIPFSFVIPKDTPITVGQASVWLKTGLDIRNAVDPKDEDFIQVSPTIEVNNVIQALDKIGFVLRKSTCIAAPRKIRGNYPFVQEFEFIPRGQFRGLIDELEIIFYVKDNHVDILIEIDKNGRGLFGLLKEAVDVDEQFVRLSIDHNDNVNKIATKLTNILHHSLQ